MADFTDEDDVKGNSLAQLPFTVVLPMAVQALVVSEDFGHHLHQFVPAVQPDYSTLLRGEHAGELKHDLMDSLDMSFWRMQASCNSRFVDLTTGRPRAGRQGVYLSWCLPKLYRTAMTMDETALSSLDDRKQWEERKIREGYKRAQQKQNVHEDHRWMNEVSGELVIRSCPDRWVVVRRVRSQPDKTRHFLVESNCVRTMDHVEFADSQVHDMETTTCPAMDPSLPLSKQSQLRMGRVTEISPATAQSLNKNATKGLTYRGDFNGITAGHEFFADYQPHNMGVFSFFDALDGLDAAEVDYMVMGFHADPIHNDPLVVNDALEPDQDGNERILSNAELLSNLQLALSGDDKGRKTFLGAGASPIPRTVTHGILRRVPWDRRVSNNLYCPATTIQEDIYEHQPIAIGMHTLDALAAYLHLALDPADALSGKTIHKMLGQLPMLIARDQDVDSQRQAADEVAGYSWLAKPEGTIWQFPSRAADSASLSGSGAPATGPQVTKEQTEKLRELNDKQIRKDTCVREQNQLVQRLYWCWWNAASIVATPDTTITTRRRQQVQKLSQEVVSRMDSLHKHETNLDTEIEASKSKLEASLGSQTQSLIAVPAASFGQHRDPTVVVAGLSSGWPSDFNKPSVIRLASEIGPTTKPPRSWLDDALPEVARPYKALLRELHEDDTFTRQTAWRANPYSHLEDFGNSQGWFPLFLEWEIEYYHIPFSLWSFEADSETGRWRYIIPGKTQLSTNDETGLDRRTIKGRSVFVPEPGRTLRTRLGQLFSQLGTDVAEVQDERMSILDKVADLEYFSAPLSGLSDDLVTLKRGSHPRPSPLDLTALKIMGVEPKALTMLQKADNSLAPYGTAAWLPSEYTASFSAFKPVSHGQARFTKFAVVGKFGQVVSGLRPGEYGQGTSSALYPGVSPSLSCGVVDGKGHWPNTVLQAEHNENGEGLCQFFQIPPRINQAARLNAHYMEPLGPDDEGRPERSARRVADAQTSPIWAWLLPNFVGHSIQVYDRHGDFAMEIMLDMEMGTVTQSLGPHTGGFLQPARGRLGFLLARMLSYDFSRALFDMLAGASDSSRTYDISLDATPAAALGRPFCIADVGVSIELATAPLQDQSLISEEAGPMRAAFGSRRPAEPDLLDYPFPVAFGSHKAAFDGLVGTFESSGDITRVATAFTRDATKLSSASSGFATEPTPQEQHPQPVQVTPYYFAGDFISPQTSSPTTTPCFEAHEAHLKCISAILDPKAPLHIYSGSLFPMVTLELPQGPVDAALKSMRAFFAVGPMLVPRKPEPAEVSISSGTPADALSSVGGGDVEPQDLSASVQMPMAGRQGLSGGGAWQWLQPYRTTAPPPPLAGANGGCGVVDGDDTLWMTPMPIRPLDTTLKVEESVLSEVVEGYVIVQATQIV